MGVFSELIKEFNHLVKIDITEINEVLQAKHSKKNNVQITILDHAQNIADAIDWGILPLDHTPDDNIKELIRELLRNYHVKKCRIK